MATGWRVGSYLCSQVGGEWGGFFGGVVAVVAVVVVGFVLTCGFDGSVELAPPLCSLLPALLVTLC